jgi:cytochrome c biogenesis protein
VSDGIVGAGRTVDLATGEEVPPGETGSGSTIAFPELRQYSVFLVSRDAGVPLVLVAAILILVGLLPALYSSRRKIWVRADPAEAGSVVRVGGLAMQRKPQFEEEFARLVEAIATAAGSSVPPAVESAREADEHERVQTP